MANRKETDEELIRQAEKIYRIMNFVWDRKPVTAGFTLAEFLAAVAVGHYEIPAEEVLALAREFEWVEIEGDRLRFTDTALEYESGYWATFR